LGIEAAARAEVQGALRTIAETGDSSAPAGLVAMLRRALDVLRGAEGAWTHAGAQNHLPMSPEQAEEAFVSAAHAARLRFEHELIRSHEGTLTTAPAPELPAPSGAGGV